MYVDEASNSKGSNVGVILEGLDNIFIKQSVKFDWKASNNQAEYEALIMFLKLAIKVGIKKFRCRSDSKLVTKQVNEVFQARETQMQKYYHLIKQILEHSK